MKTLIGGAIAVIIGTYCFSVFFPEFIDLLTGSVPILLILGGGLAIYLNYDEIRENFSKEPAEPDAPDYGFDEDEPAKIATEDNPTAGTAARGSASEGAVENPVFVGNAGSRVFHNPDCKFAQNIKEMTGFATQDEALQADYKPCGVCKP